MEEGSDVFDLKAQDFSIGSFVVAEEEEKKKNVDLGETRFEIVSDEREALLTQEPKFTEQQLKDAYGDLPEEVREKRRDVEAHFLAAKPDQKHLDVLSHPLKRIDNCIIVGTNGIVSWAFECVDAKKFVHKEEETEETDAMDAFAKSVQASKEYAKDNPAHRFKSASAGLEQNAFYHHGCFNIAHLIQSTNAKLMAREFQAIAKVDKSLVGVMRMLGPKISKAMKELPESAQPRPIQAMQRPGNAYANVLHSIEDQGLPEKDAHEYLEKYTTYKLLSCETPHVKAKMHARKQKKNKNRFKEMRTKWKEEEGVSFKCLLGTVPSASFNDTHLAILYMPAVKNSKGLLRLCVYEIAKGYKEPVCEKEFRFPSDFSKKGMLCTALSATGMFSATLSSGAVVFDALNDSKSMYTLCLTLEEETDVIKRNITCVSFAKDDPELLLLGTDKGECYCIKWETGEQYNIECTPAVEPVFSASVSNDHTFIGSVMGAVICRPNIPVPVFLDIDRPLAFDTCGGLVFVMTKYGGLKFFHKNQRGIVHACEPVSQKDKHIIGGVQHAYPGVRAFQNRVVCVYPDGTVRNYELIL